MKYVSLFFAQGDDAAPWLDDLDSFGAENILPELIFNAPDADAEPEPVKDAPWGASDCLCAFWRDNSAYVVSFNFKLGVVALTRVDGLYVEQRRNNILGQYIEIHARPSVGPQIYEGYEMGEAILRFLFING